MQAKKAGADEGLMLDPQGFVATCNSVNFFCVRNGELWAPTRKYQMHGITRQKTLDIAEKAGIKTRELDFTLTQVYSADECFVTGTFAGQLPVVGEIRPLVKCAKYPLKNAESQLRSLQVTECKICLHGQNAAARCRLAFQLRSLLTV